MGVGGRAWWVPGGCREHVEQSWSIQSGWSRRGWEGKTKAGASLPTELPKPLPSSVGMAPEGAHLLGARGTAKELAKLQAPRKQQVKVGFLGYRELSSCSANDQEETPALLCRTGRDFCPAPLAAGQQGGDARGRVLIAG